MTIERPISDTQEQERRIEQALLRGVAENLRSSRLAVPIFAAAIGLMFLQWLEPGPIIAWYAQVLIGLTPQTILLWRFPHTDLGASSLRKWTLYLSAANFFFMANWASLGWHFWTPGKNGNHLVIQLILAATLMAQVSMTGPCRKMVRPVLLLLLAAMLLAQAQVSQAHSLSTSVLLALGSPFYVAFAAILARKRYQRARAAVLLTEERDTLMDALVAAKLESDRGRERAEAASLAKSQFLANMSHELRTPLNAILGFSELIATRMFQHDPERNVEYAGLIHSSGKHLLALINDILDLAKIEAGRWQLEEGEIDLHRVAEDALQLVAWRAKDNGATLKNSVDPAVPMLYADERAIKQVLLNLLSNAAKFTPADGVITTFAHVMADGGLSFGVSDTGVGIAAEDQDKVFDSFGQGKHDIALADKGTGLGLAIVKGLIESHGGHVMLESEPGKGTRVTVMMPAQRVFARTSRAHFVA